MVCDCIQQEKSSPFDFHHNEKTFGCIFLDVFGAESSETEFSPVLSGSVATYRANFFKWNKAHWNTSGTSQKPFEWEHKYWEKKN